MKRILVRAGKQPFSSHSVIECLDRGHNLSNVGNLLFQFAFIRHVYRPDHYKIDTIRDPGPDDLAPVFPDPSYSQRNAASLTGERRAWAA